MFYSRASQRRIAKTLAVDRKTVAKIIAEHEQARRGAPLEKRKPRKSLLDPFQDHIAQLLERYPEITAVRMLGGLAAECLYDNMKVVVSGHDGEQPIYNTRFLAFATYYGFRPVACRPRRPETKGKVERQFQLLEGNLLNGRTFSSLQHLNQTTAWWLAHVADVRQHKTTRRTPLDLFQEELPHLLPLPERPYDTAEVVYRTVNPEGYLSYLQNF